MLQWMHWLRAVWVRHVPILRECGWCENFLALVSSLTMHAGLRDEGEVAQEDSQLLLDLVTATFPEVAPDVVEIAIQKKTERKYS